MAQSKVSAPMLAALRRMIETEQPLVRWPGGFWTTRGTNEIPGRAGVPAWYCGTNMMRSLTSRGLVERAGVHAEEWRDERTVTVLGLEAVTASLRDIDPDENEEAYATAMGNPPGPCEECNFVGMHGEGCSKEGT